MTDEKNTLVYAHDLTAHNFQIFEVPEHVLSDIQSNAGSVILKGAFDDEAVLCTSSKTYSVRLAETSNSMLLVNKDLTSQLSGVPFIEGCLTTHLELVEIMPRIHRLEQLLSQHYYEGEDKEFEDPHHHLYTFEHLKRAVQASDEELKEGLKKLNAFERRGFYRIMSPQLENEIIEFILTESVANDWPLTKIPEKECLGALGRAGFDHFSITRCLQVYSEGRTKEGTWFISSDKVALFRAIQLLKLSSKNWSLDSFLNEWKNVVPDGVQVDLNLLKGIAMVNLQTTPQSIQYLPLSSLSTDIRSRCQQLFAAKAMWEIQELEPFFRDLVPPTTSFEKFASKYMKLHQTPQGRFLTEAK